MATFLRRALTTSLAVAATTLAGLVVVAPPAEAAFPGQFFILRPGDFIRPTGTLGAATMQVESDGVHIHTSAPSDLATATFDAPYHPSLGVLLTPYYPDVEYQWTG